MMGSVVSLLNQKGGVGKASSCHHLSGALARMGRRILLIDNDPQASLTQGFFGPEAMRSLAFSESVAALYDEEHSAVPEVVIRATGVAGVDLVPGSVRLTRYNQLPVDRWADSERGIREFADEVRDTYDLILIDCPPNLHLCGWAALTASDGIVVPLQAEDYGAQGIVAVLEAIDAVRLRTNPRVRLLGLLLTMYDKRLGIHLAYEKHLREIYGEQVFEATFPLAKDFKEAVAARQPVTTYKPRAAAAKATIAIGEELLRRIAEKHTDAEGGSNHGPERSAA
jgi:chromosome partitioning protein